MTIEECLLVIFKKTNHKIIVVKDVDDCVGI